jgi:hypothetical protein
MEKFGKKDAIRNKCLSLYKTSMEEDENRTLIATTIMNGGQPAQLILHAYNLAAKTF